MTAAPVAKLGALHGFEWELSTAARSKHTAKYCMCVLPSTSWLCLVIDLLNLDSVHAYRTAWYRCSTSYNT
jgi:hypothetical protein